MPRTTFMWKKPENSTASGGDERQAGVWRRPPLRAFSLEEAPPQAAGFFTLSVLMSLGLLISPGLPRVPPSQTLAGFQPTLAAQSIDLCPSLPPPTGNIVNVSTEDGLWNAVNTAQEGDTILLADGTYNLGQNEHYVWIDTPNVTLRSASGNREAVILDDNYSGSEIVSIVASNVTVADLTIKRAGTHPIHVMSTSSSDTLNTLIYNVHIIDPGQQAIKINPASAGHYPDDGTIACSHIELTDAGRVEVLNINGDCYTGGVDAHQAQGWVIRDNLIEGFWCSSGLSEHGIHMWSNCRDTLVERNRLVENARGIGFGLGSSGHVGGIIRNNMVYVMQDVGIGLESSPNSRVYNNTVYTENYFNSIEYRFGATTGVEIINNLTNEAIASRDGGSGTVQNNVTDAQSSWFVSATTGDLHLVSDSIASVIDQGQTLADVSDDFDGESRPQGSVYDIGADEYSVSPPAAVTDLRVTTAVTGTGTLTATLRWTAPTDAVTATLRYSGALITDANWATASLLTDTLPGSAEAFTATVPYGGDTVYFAHRSQNASGGWSAVSNNAFWPHWDIYLPLVIKDG
jgi:hypothetical protein